MALTNQPGYRPTLVHLSVRCVVPIAGGEAGAGDFAFCSMRSNTLQARSCAPACAYSSIMLAVCCAFSAGAYAQSSAATGVVMEETVVAATRSSQPLSDTLADVSIVDRETLDLSGAAALEDVLSRLPGVEMVRNGGPGSTTSVYLRGANNEFTAVYIDGIRVDMQSGSGGAPWEAMPLEAIERVEVLRGPAGAVYGSDAIGGVIQILTRKGEGPARPSVSVGVGSYGTRNGAANLSGGNGVADYALGVSYAEADGFSARTRPQDNPDDDGYRRKSARARVGLQLNADHRLEGTLLHSTSNVGYDTSKADDRAINSLNAAGLSWSAQWSAHYRTKLSLGESRQEYETQPSPYQTKTLLRNYLWQNEWQAGIHRWSATLERREDQLTNASITPQQRQRHQNALALGWGMQSGAHTLQLSARHDDDSEFDGKTTGSAAYAYALTPQWRVHASTSTAFRVPTLYQRFSAYGDASLRPQDSRNAEIGVRWGQGSQQFSATAYRNRVNHLINYVSGPGACASAYGCYENVDKAVYEGITLAGAYKLGMVRWSGSLDFQNPRNETLDKQLARRAKRHAVLAADTLLAGWNLGAQMQAYSQRFDDAANRKTLGGYTLWNLYASRSLGRDLTLLARVDNLADKHYQLADTYGVAGRAFYVGLKWEPQ